MVMKKNIMRKNLTRSICRSITRYIAIVAIIALGAGLFVGLLATKTDMVATGQSFMDSQNMFDLRLLNSYGWTQEQLEKIRAFSGVVDAEGVIMLDAVGSTDKDGAEKVYQLYALPESVDKPLLLGGRMPAQPGECLLDGHFATDAILGTKLYISASNEKDTLESLTVTEFTVVGYVSTPLFMDMTRGTTTLGDGSVSAYVYLPREAFNVDYYTGIHVTVAGEYRVYTQEYDDAMEHAAEEMEPKLLPLAQQRYDRLRQDTQKAYDEGIVTYEEALQEYRDGKAQAEQELSDALKKLQEGQKELADHEASLKDAQKQISAAWAEIRENQKLLTESRETLEQTKAQTYAPLEQSRAELDEAYESAMPQLTDLNERIAAVDGQIAQWNTQIEPLQTALAETEANILRLNATVASLDVQIAAIQAALDGAQDNPFVSEEDVTQWNQRLSQLQAEREDAVHSLSAYTSQRDAYSAQLQPLYSQRQPLLQEKAELELQRAPLEVTVQGIQSGYAALDTLKAQADSRFAEAEAELTAGEQQLAAAVAELNRTEQEVNSGLTALEDGKLTLQQNWKEYDEALAEAEQKFADAERELADGKAELDEAKEFLETLAEPKVYILDRNTNVGYLAVDSNSNIVAGVSRVFPVFFLLVAALVCITTMTRMVEEERTQIGTLKALGYSNGKIISKYLLYAGSAAVLGCGLGVLVGSVVFPCILWTAYNLILSLRPELEIVFDIPLCVAVTAAYTLVVCAVTWCCCRMSLREVPAELIRPKPPTSGRKILMEYLPFWEKISFLNKVMIRNIFRYRQRLLMMLVGIGGCTALLVTGFGIGDSIVDIVSFQFEEVTLYDIQVQFDGGRTEEQMAQFRKEMRGEIADLAFAHQSSIELDFGDGTKSVYMISTGDDMTGFFDFHCGQEPLAMPGVGEALISAGVAEAMGITPGDSVRIRNSDMQGMDLTVSGVFDNHVYNYVFVHPQSVIGQWGSAPEFQLAYVNVDRDSDPHSVSAELWEASDVMSVMVNQDLADQVGSMLQAMNLVVATVVVCAGLLAIIVIYNLTNININERLREIATIKVLGFTAFESAAYVFKENLILSVVGAALGLIGGKLLLDFVMSQIKIDMVWFLARVLPTSLIWSVLITVSMAVLVDVILYFKLDKINMAEALKPVE